MMINKRFLGFIVIGWLFSLLFFNSCAHQKNEFIIGLNKLSRPYYSKSSSNVTVKLNYYDIAPYLSGIGFQWDSFVLPILSNYEVSESELLLGYLAGPDNFISPPQNGSCKILQKETRREEKKKRLVSFASSSRHPEENAGDLFLLLDYVDLSPFALIKLNKQGLANCYLPNSTYHLSYGFGSHRKEFLVNMDEKNTLIKINFERKGVLKVDPNLISNLQNGDLIRLGRKIGIQTDFSPTGDNLIPTKMGDDLFKPSNFESQQMGVDETFHTSFLLGQTPFNIRLSLGDYVIAVVRKNALVCLKEIKISESEPANLECPATKAMDVEEKIFNSSGYNVVFDPTFFPESLNQESYFEHWYLSNKSNFMSIFFNENKDIVDDSKEKNISFLFLPKSGVGVREFPTDFKLKINDENSFLPLYGTGIENIVRGAIPFSRFTSLRFQYPLEHSHLLEASYLEGTNGTEIKLFEPYLSKEGKLTSILEQRFRFRISVPSWNSTNLVEMRIDGKLQRRWVLNRGQLSEPFSVTLDEKTFQKKDFTVRLTAWGEKPLPDFIYGVNDQMPYARTRDYLVTIDKPK